MTVTQKKWRQNVSGQTGLTIWKCEMQDKPFGIEVCLFRFPNLLPRDAKPVFAEACDLLREHHTC